MKLIFAVLYVSLNDGQFFTFYYLSAKVSMPVTARLNYPVAVIVDILLKYNHTATHCLSGMILYYTKYWKTTRM